MWSYVDTGVSKFVNLGKDDVGDVTIETTCNSTMSL